MTNETITVKLKYYVIISVFFIVNQFTNTSALQTGGSMLTLLYIALA